MKKFYSQNKYTIIGYFFMIVSSLILSLSLNQRMNFAAMAKSIASYSPMITNTKKRQSYLG